MARNVVLVAFGVMLGVVAGAAFGVRAAGEGGVGDDVLATPSTTDAEESPPTPEPAYGIWDRLAACESTSNWHIYSPPYYGGVQQDMTFWRRYGGLAFAPRPDLASRAQQIVVAERGLAVQGWGAWPACSRRLGLR